MTQAYNLSQLANNLNTAGQVDATDGLVNAVPLVNGGTGATSAAAARTNLGVAAAVYAVPAGGIIMWSGSVASIPTGWFLCNGGNGTPNLLDRFVVAAGSSYAVGQTGGSADATLVNHTHSNSVSTVNLDHTHSWYNTAGSGSSNGYAANDTNNEGAAQTGGMSANATHLHTVTINAAGVSATNANLPPFYALAYIMKS